VASLQLIHTFYASAAGFLVLPPIRLYYRDRMETGQVTQWLAQWRAGGHDALEHVVPLVYAELRQAARRQLWRESASPTLSATALVHEVYLRLVQQRQIQASDRQGFLAIAGQTMRRILVDHARARHRLKRGADAQPVPLEEQDVPALLSDIEVEEVLAIEAALEKLAAFDERAARIVEYRVFAGLTLEETALALDVAVKTVQRTWVTARAWLRKEIGGPSRLV
jgi:RNA polymerase sigma factor (TIGR02999 family)